MRYQIQPCPMDRTVAPPFTLTADDGTEAKLESFRGQWVLLLFYPRDFSPVCTEQLCHYRDEWEALELPGVRVFGISPDTVERHREFRRRYAIPFPLLADPQQEVFRRYGMVTLGLLPARGVVVVDPEGIVRYRWKSSLGLRYPKARELRSLLLRLQEGGAPRK